METEYGYVIHHICFTLTRCDQTNKRFVSTRYAATSLNDTFATATDGHNDAHMNSITYHANHMVQCNTALFAYF
jgi:hypothetical protein